MMVGKDIGEPLTKMPKDAYYNGKDVPTFNAYLTIIVRDKDGKVIRVHRQRSHSPTYNFIYLLLPYSFYSTSGATVTIINTSSGSSSWTPTVNLITYPNTQTNHPSYLIMIQVGAGSQSNPSAATNLAAPITSGTGNGQLVYGAVSVSSNITASGNSAYFYITQTFSNESGANVSITEIGIITQIQVNGLGCGNVVNFGSLLVWYDVLSSAITVPSQGAVTIYYTFTVNP
jgi:hypothetical protein